MNCLLFLIVTGQTQRTIDARDERTSSANQPFLGAPVSADENDFHLEISALNSLNASYTSATQGVFARSRRSASYSGTTGDQEIVSIIAHVAYSLFQ